MATFSIDDRNRLLKYLQVSPLVTTYIGTESAQGEITQLQSKLDALTLFDTRNSTNFVGEVVDALDQLDEVATRLTTVNLGVRSRRVDGEYSVDYNSGGPASGDVLKKQQLLARICQLLGYASSPGTSGRIVRS